MSQIKSLKETLENSHTTYKRAKAALSRVLPTDPNTDNTSSASNVTSLSTTSTRVLTQKIGALEDALNELNLAHTSWVSKAEISVEDLVAHPFSNEWLEGIWEESDVVIDRG